MVDYSKHDPYFDLDRTDPGWMKVVEADADERFAGPGSKWPFARATYLWGRTAIYIVEFHGWTPRNSANKALERLLEANVERMRWMPDGDLALYVEVWTAHRAEAKSELEALFTGLPLKRTTVVLGTPAQNYTQLDVAMVMEW